MGIKAFVDQFSMKPADQADTEMMRALRTAPIGLAILSEDFFNVERSPWPLCELRMIVEGGEKQKLLPVVWRDITHNDLRDLLTAGLAQAFTLGQKAEFRQSRIAHGLQFCTPGQRNDLARRVTRTTALVLSEAAESADLSLNDDCERVCCAVLTILADHIIRVQHAVTNDSRQRVLNVVNRVEAAMTQVASGKRLPNVPAGEKRVLHKYLLDLRDINEALIEGISRKL